MRVPKPFAGSRRAGFARLCAIAAAQAGLAAGTAFVVKNAFDTVATKAPNFGTDWQPSQFGPLGILAGIALFLAWLRRCELIEAEKLGQSFTHAVRLVLYDRLGSLTPRDLQKQSRGGHLLRFIGDLTALRQWISLGLARLIVASITAAFALTALAFINLTLAATVAGVLAIGCVASLTQGKSLHIAVREARRQRARLAGDVSERIAVMPVVQMFSQVRRERGRIERRSGELRDAMITRARAVGSLRGLAEATTGISLAAILAAGAYEVGHGRASLGAVVAAMSVLGILTPALRDLSRVYEYWQGYRVAIARIREFANMRPSVKARSSAPALPAGPGEIAFENVVFADVLDGVTATAQAESIVAIVGPNAAGKSTLLSLVARLIEPSSGDLLIDGNNLRQHSAVSIRASIGVVSPDLPLMRGTIGRNIRYRSPKASEAEVRHICALCGVDEILANIPGGMEARVVEGGLNLSPGQRQRIVLARAMLGGPSILLLDEVDANMDPQSAGLMDNILQTYPGTILFVSHRPEQIALADVIWHVADGSIIEQGAPADLLHRDGSTRRLLHRPLGLVA
ncbi:MAG TPA: ABC transporter ATP-binding protein [Thermohalobaculum sp.]|nr:ABC transporter ATP-binding protein [Thermohalobaculum sp.]